jgi:deoxyribodipyrimidine photo-lyase
LAIYESIQDLQKKLNPINATIYFFHNEVATVFKELVEQYEIKNRFSHKIGNKVTYDRDVDAGFLSAK